MPLVGNSTLGYSTKAAAASDLRKMGNRFFAAGAALAVGSVDALFDDGGLGSRWAGDQRHQAQHAFGNSS